MSRFKQIPGAGHGGVQAQKGKVQKEFADSLPSSKKPVPFMICLALPEAQPSREPDPWFAAKNRMLKALMECEGDVYIALSIAEVFWGKHKQWMKEDPKYAAKVAEIKQAAAVSSNEKPVPRYDMENLDGSSGNNDALFSISGHLDFLIAKRDKIANEAETLEREGRMEEAAQKRMALDAHNDMIAECRSNMQCSAKRPGTTAEKMQPFFSLLDSGMNVLAALKKTNIPYREHMKGMKNDPKYAEKVRAAILTGKKAAHAGEKRSILSLLENGESLGSAFEKMQISRLKHYYWLKTDPEYAEKVEAAISKGAGAASVKRAQNKAQLAGKRNEAKLEKMRAIISSLEAGEGILVAVEKAKVYSMAHYRWMKTDPEYAKKVKAAMKKSRTPGAGNPQESASAE